MGKNLFELFEQTVREKASFIDRPMVYAGNRKRGEVHCIFVFERFEADFCLMMKGAAPGMRNLVDCRIRQPGERILWIPLSRCLQEIESDSYTCTVYPYVATEEELNAVTDELCALFKRTLPSLLALFEAPQGRELFAETAYAINSYVEETLFEESDGTFILNPELDENYAKQLARFYYVNRAVTRFTQPFVALYTGKGCDTERMQSKAGEDSEYRLLAQTDRSKIYYTDLQKSLYTDSRKSNSLKVIPALLLYFLLGIPLALLIALPVYLFGAGYFSSATLASSSLSFGALSCLLVPAELGGICLFTFDQRLLYRIIYGKKAYKGHVAMMSGAEVAIPRFLGMLLTVFLVLFTLLHGAQTVRFEEDRFGDGTELYSTKETFYDYEEISAAGYVRDGAGEETLVFLLENGRTVEVCPAGEYEYTDYAKDKILPILARKGIVPEGSYGSIDDFISTVGKADEKTGGKKCEETNETV